MKPQLLLFAGLCFFFFATTVQSDQSETSIITSDRFGSSLEDPLSSASLLDGGFLERSVIRELSESFRVMANVTVADSVDSGFLIRGINSEGIGLPSGSPLATLYVDGIAQSRDGARRGALGTWDLKEIRVMRGPQGTRGGRNSIAGQIRIETNDPTFHEESSLLIGLGEHGFFESAVMVSGPITDTLAARITAEIQHQEGEFNYPLFEGFPRLEERMEDNYYQIRGKLLYQPSGDKGPSALLSASHSYDSPQYQDVDGPSAGVAWGDRIWGLQSLPVFIEARSTEVSQVNLSVSLPISDYWSMESLTGVVRTVTETPSVDLATRGEIDEVDVSQELRATYDQGPLGAVAGFYVLDGSIDQLRFQQLPFNAFESQEVTDSSFTNFAFYGEVSFQILPRWSLFGGLRYDHEQQGFSSIYKSVDGEETLTTEAASANMSDDAVLPKAGILYEFNNKTTLGLKAQQSYRPAGMAFDRLNELPYQYEAESAWNYELSLKGSTPDGKLSYSANVFYLDWQDQQINVSQIPGDINTAIITNAENSKVYGAELEVQTVPTRGLSLFASLGIAKTEFEDFTFTQFRSPTDFSGNSFPHAPDYTAAVGIDYQFQNGFFIGADVKYTSSSISRSIFEGLGRDELSGYTVANLRAGFRKDNWSITAFVSNVTDEEYFLYRYDTPKLQVGTLGLERFCGLRVTVNF